MQETAKEKAETKGLVYWGHLESKDVLDPNGRFVGILRGFVITSDWTIPKVVIEVNRSILDELGIEKPLLSVALVELPTEFVRNGTDVAQLTGDVNSLKWKAELYFAP